MFEIGYFINVKEKTMKKLIVASVLALTTLAGLATSPKVQARSTTKSAKVSFKQYKINKKYKNGVKAKFSYNLPQLKGKSAAIKKINKDLKKIYSSEKKDSKTVFYCAKQYDSKQAGAIKDTCYDLTKTSVSYNKNGIISFKVDHNWWAGAQDKNKKIPYHVIGGLTYSLKNGKRLSIADIAKGSKSSVRKQLIAGATKKFKIKKSETIYFDMLGGKVPGTNTFYDVRLNYYLKGGKVYLYPNIIEPLNYEFTHHNPPIYYNSHFTIPSRYK
ncbi:hypothetical protein FC20_GL001826 [Lactobacillus equicursoris DSM 19284 = JCM 14600 = CIP 110162]|uniref:Deacetylase PdaC domain-containing protein n=2 Tax=Lactobacillus equicursoris TaxID=420645 RepID=A0A0R1LUL5_9LACO|nr:hypothetical protein FC20_GL001826 [Lactobacillus equicursoris DSM 19284 = JCM 14600 = CIP 110162]